MTDAEGMEPACQVGQYMCRGCMCLRCHLVVNYLSISFYINSIITFGKELYTLDGSFLGRQIYSQNRQPRGIEFPHRKSSPLRSAQRLFVSKRIFAVRRKKSDYFRSIIWPLWNYYYFCTRVSPIRHAPFDSPRA